MTSPKTLSLTALLSFPLALLSGCSEPSAEEQEILRPVRAITISQPESGQMKSFPGVVEAAQQADLSFRVSGRLAAIHVREGDHVISGQVLAELDPIDFDIRLKDRQAAYDVARTDYDRALQLIGKGAIARADVDSLKAKLSTATAQLETARQEKAYTRLRAPFPGQIARVHADNFEEVSAKQEILALHDLSSLFIKVDMPESLIASARQERQPLLYSARFDSLGDTSLPLELSAFSALANNSSQTYTVTFLMSDNPGARILPGMSATVQIEQVAPDSDWLIIPAHAVQEDNRGRFVYLVQAAKPGVGTGSGVGIVSKRTVTTGNLLASGIEVTSGLTTGEQLIIAGMSQMHDGMRVRWTREVQ